MKTGIDIGSTTAKAVILDSENNIIFSEYKRHNTRIYDTVTGIIKNAISKLGNFKTTISVTGSAGMGMSENSGLPFIQEVIAATELVGKKYPKVKTLIDIGGEDSKMIFFHEDKIPDIRMNGSCAGGTGAFIDRTASLLNVSLPEFNELSKKYSKIYPIASRCGVFAKTDIQNLLSRKIAKEDITASVFHAVAVQTINTLARGSEIVPKIMFTGGPFTFMPELLKIFMQDLKLSEADIIMSENPALMPAHGAAINETSFEAVEAEKLLERIKKAGKNSVQKSLRLKPIFKSKKEFSEWNKQKIKMKVPRVSLDKYSDKITFIGIDSGSTTTKIALIGKNNELLFNFYSNNNGNPIETVKKGLTILKNKISNLKPKNKILISRTAVTGYGEDLIKAAFGIDTGIVETIAHYEAAKFFNKNVSFIMDIGGQDMKAIFIKNGAVQRIELNEACSAGCGSFIETFGKSLGHKVADFAEIACNSQAPCDLGTRCTVFMNSKVKQSLRENAGVNDIAGGLSISVIKNALYKVLKITDIKILGENVVVQGGTFKNASVQKALENHIGRKVICTDIPEQMGAYGAARTARTEYFSTNENKKNIPEISTFIGLENLTGLTNFKTKQVLCKGCENLCTVTRFLFNDNLTAKKNSIFYSGNKCEKIFSNKGTQTEKGINFYEEKVNLIFNRSGKAKILNKKLKVKKIGIPRVLNIFENFPFWNTLFTNCGIDIELSSPSTVSLYEKGKGTVMSDSICFPAKIVHGHIYDLYEKNVDRIFYPTVIYETNEYEKSDNSFNCPIVSSYSEVISSSMNPERNYNIPLDYPVFNLNNKKLLEKACYEYLKKLGVDKKIMRLAFEKSYKEYKNYRNKISERGAEIINNAIKNKKMLVVLAGRPYHADPFINHKTPDILSDMGVDVITEDAVPKPKRQDISNLQVISQWSYPNRIYNAAQWVAEQKDNIQFVQINSFGCGPDSLVIDECVDILETSGKNFTLIRVDEITSTGSVRLRLRSMLEALKIRDKNFKLIEKQRITTNTFKEKDKKRVIIAPYFSNFYSSFLPALFKLEGYTLKILPKPNKQSVQYGLKYSNNEICYPATVIVGDILKFLHESKYNRKEIAVAITQTGGQCRASSYLSLIKRGMINSGYSDIPVVSIGTSGKTINPQPGFDFDWKKILPVTFVSVIFADSLQKLLYSTVVREKNKGESRKLAEYYKNKAYQLILKKDINALYNLLRDAVFDFNKIEINKKFYPKIGLVGEIYIIYNSFVHPFIVDWLIEQGIEVVLPPVLNFFTQEFVNIKANKKKYIFKAEISNVYLWFLEQLANKHIRRANRILKKFRYYDPFRNIRHEAQKASKIINLANQFGEGWLIPAEISSFSERGINNVVSVQPFGCIANHIVSKGVEKRMKELFPKLNLLFLDFDDGTSEVNILNRLHFMVRNVSN